jgi:amino acid transporter
MYTLLAWAMPRAGGDYVWTGRILHPALGLSLNLTWVVYGSLFMGSYANYTITYGLYSIFLAFGIATRNYGLVDWSRAVFTSPFWIITFATIFLIYVSLIMIFGLRTHLKHQLVAWIVGMVGTIVALVLFLNTTPTQFAVAFDSLMGRYSTYQGVIDTAKSYGFSWAPSLAATFAAMAFAWEVNNGYQYSGYFAGELKQTRKSMFYSTIGNNLFCTFFFVLFAWAFVSAVGENWNTSLSYLAYAQSSAYKLPLVPNAYLLASLLTNNLALVLLINIGFIVWAMTVPANWMAWTRIILAQSFDRVLPSKLADVSDRYHSPVNAIIFVAVINWIGMVASTVYGLLFANLNFILMYTIALSIGGLTGALFPFIAKSFYEKSPLVRYKVGGVPLVTITGIITFLFFAYLAFAAGLNPVIGGPTNPVAMIVLLLSFVGSGCLYYVAKMYHKSKSGIDIALNFKEIPPE